MKKCLYCSAVQYIDGYNYCSNCGYILVELDNVCSNCKWELEDGDKYCPICGTKREYKK